VPVRLILAFSCLAAAAFGIAGCGHKSSDGSKNTRTTLTIYASQPLQGLEEDQSESIVNAERLALAEAGGRVGRFTIKYVALDDSTAATGGPDPGQTAADARKAVQDGSTIVYLGESDAGASAMSIPLTNEVGLLQISPTETPSGFTRHEGGAKDEPDRYYPSGKRTFARVVPADNVQATALASYQRDQGCRTTAVVSDGGLFGRGLVSQFAIASKAKGPSVAMLVAFTPGSKATGEIARQVSSSHADCALFAMTATSAPARLIAAVHRADPTVKLFLPSALAQRSITSQLPASAQRVSYVTSPALDPRLYPPTGRRFFTSYRVKFGKEAAPVAIFGYEAMKLALLAIQNAGDRGNDPPSVVDAVFHVKDHDSPLGTYSIDANGDTSLSDYGAYRIDGGKLVFDSVIKTGS
jgi:branched-chain amino acid transport system substrate-binding protein